MMHDKYSKIGGMTLPPGAKLLYSFLCDCTLNTGGELRMSRRNIAAYVKMSPGAISRNMHRLMSAGYIFIVPTYTEDGGRASNKYIIRR